MAADGSIVRVGHRSRSTTALAFRKADHDGRYSGDQVSCCQGDDVDLGVSWVIGVLRAVVW